MSSKSFPFSISERKLLLRFFDIGFSIVGVVLLYVVFEVQYFKIETTNILKYLLVLVFYILFFGEILEMYNLRIANDRYLVLRSSVITGLLTTLFYVFTPILTPELPENRIQILYFFLAITVPIYFWRILYIQFIFSPKFFNRVLIIGSSKTETLRLINLIKSSSPENQIVGYICPEAIDNLDLNFFPFKKLSLEILAMENHVGEFIVDGIKESSFISSFTSQFISLFKKGYKITSADKFTASITERVPKVHLNENFYNHINFSNSQRNRAYLIFHRVFDVIGSLVGIVFLGCMLPVVFIGNQLLNKGKLFYFQERVGKGGDVFKIIKLRTMICSAENNGAVWAVKNDSRITKFGKFLRRSRMDEVPQFLNILKGDMSIIGPRPERPEFVDELSNNYPFYSIRNVIKPGLTGWAQVKYPYASTKEEQYVKLRYDLYYIKERNLLLDFKIIIKTISTVLFLRGT